MEPQRVELSRRDQPETTNNPVVEFRGKDGRLAGT